MKKRLYFVLTTLSKIATVLVLACAACDNGTADNTVSFAPLVITGKDSQLKNVEVTFTSGREAAEEGAPLTEIQTGDSYVIELDGGVLSEGKITVAPSGAVTFTPEKGEPFYGSYIAGVLRFYDGPLNGFVQDGTQSSGTPSGNGGGGGPSTFTVTFNANGGSAVPAATAPLDGTGTVDEPITTRAGYGFAGWYSDVDLTIPYDFDTLVTGSFTLYAKWTPFTPADSGLYIEINHADNAWSPVDGFTAISGANIATAVTHVSSNEGVYLMLVGDDISVSDDPLPLPVLTDNILTVRGVGDGATITLAANSSLFTVETGAELTLSSGITLKGHSGNTASLVTVTGSETTFTMKDGSTITGNGNTNTATTYSGGGVYVNDGTFTMEGGTISGNTADSWGSGGGVSISGGTFTMRGGTISDNTAEGGGGVYVINGGTFTMTADSKVINNKTNGAYGGGVYVGSVYVGGVLVGGATFTMESGTISGNTSGYGGGGVLFSGATFTMESGTISGNKCGSIDSPVVANSGGGVNVARGSFRMRGGDILDNTAGGYGGPGYGGGVSVWDNGTFIMESGTISGNTSVSSSLNTGGDGGGVYVSDGTFTMEGDAAITGNNADNDGGGVSAAAGTFTMESGTISGNTAGFGGGGVCVQDGLGAGYGDGIFTKTGSAEIYSNYAVKGKTAYYVGPPEQVVEDTSLDGHTIRVNDPLNPDEGWD